MKSRMCAINSCKLSGLKPDWSTATMPLPSFVVPKSHAHTHTHWASLSLHTETQGQRVSTLPSYVGESTPGHKPFLWAVSDSPRIRWPGPSRSPTAAAARTQCSSVAGKVTHSPFLYSLYLSLTLFLSLSVYLLLKRNRPAWKKKNTSMDVRILQMQITKELDIFLRFRIIVVLPLCS